MCKWRHSGAIFYDFQGSAGHVEIKLSLQRERDPEGWRSSRYGPEEIPAGHLVFFLCNFRLNFGPTFNVF